MMQMFLVSFQNTLRWVTFAKCVSRPKNTRRHSTSSTEVTCGERRAQVRASKSRVSPLHGDNDAQAAVQAKEKQAESV